MKIFENKYSDLYLTIIIKFWVTHKFPQLLMVCCPWVTYPESSHPFTQQIFIEDLLYGFMLDTQNTKSESTVVVCKEPIASWKRERGSVSGSE